MSPLLLKEHIIIFLFAVIRLIAVATDAAIAVFSLAEVAGVTDAAVAAINVVSVAVVNLAAVAVVSISLHFGRLQSRYHRWAYLR